MADAKVGAEAVVAAAYGAYAEVMDLKMPWEKLPKELRLAWARAIRAALQHLAASA